MPEEGEERLGTATRPSVTAGATGFLGQRRTNRLLVVISFLVGVLCASVAWKHKVRVVMAPSGHPDDSTPSLHSATGASSYLRRHIGGHSGRAGRAGLPKDSTAEFFRLAGDFHCLGTRSFTKAEVAQHNTKGDLYVVIDGNVLDVSSFLAQHAGGDALLDGAGGEDMAATFAQFHHPSTVKFFASFCVGRLQG